ncbi:hypothetical protein BgAZ_207080 [Babesia gibsoni]|uniref:methylated diphthine methylhydrolase n=1 Tax=Babesia gibsoni TaxID=33632 RepID=A0AAD8USU7_BABGI|nr:hypothetical protein BgAZ_207080 [Babesia gibsoni]
MEDGSLLHCLPLSMQPDCIKVFPSEYQVDALEGTLVAAAYQYDEDTKLRTGGIIAFNPCNKLNDIISGKEEEPEYRDSNYHIATKALNGVLSCSWIKNNKFCGVSCITADLRVTTIRLDAEVCEDNQYNRISMDIDDEIALDNDSDAIGLSLVNYDVTGSISSITSSNGYVYILENGVVKHKWSAHDMETWISAFQPGNPNVVITGSDDSTIKFFDLRESITPLKTVSRFDRQLMQFDMRNLDLPVACATLDCAVWYIDFMDGGFMNVAGCYDGAFVYHTSHIDAQYSLYKKFVPQNPLIYSVAHLELQKKTVNVCSDFYNKRILFWD